MDIKGRFVCRVGRWLRPRARATDLKAVEHQPQLAQQGRGGFLGFPQRAARHPHTPPQFPVPLPVLLKAVELTPSLLCHLDRGPQIANLLPAPVTEPQLHHPLA